MWSKTFLLVGILLCYLSFSFALNPKDLKDAVRQPHIRNQLNFVEKLWKNAQKVQQSLEVGDMSFTCALCGIAINEIEGFVAENISVSEIQSILQKDVCDHLGGFLKTTCDLLVTQIPTIIGSLENRWSVSVVCVDLGYCTRPYDQYTDPQPLPTYTINLDADPKTRCKKKRKKTFF